jgi:hypothetical protein
MKQYNTKRIGIEILELLWSYYLLKHEQPVTDDAISNMRSMKIIQLLTNDIILRLCKFRDKDSRSSSFNQLLKQEKKSNDQSQIATLSGKVKQFREITKNIERHRNSYVAHLSKMGNEHLSPLAELKEAINLAVELADLFSKEKNQYTIEGIDLRRMLNEGEIA